MKEVTIDGKSISEGFPCYTIAEIGTGYRTFEEARNLIDSAKEIGVDAIKLQTFEANTITSKKNFLNLEETGVVSQYELFKKLEIPKELQLQIVEYAKTKGMTVFSAPSHMNDLKTMEQMDLSVYKIGSDLACHIPLLKKIGKLEKPIILSTGMCTMDEIKKSVDAIRSVGNDQIILMHCVSDYPTKVEDCNLNAIQTLKEEFNIPVGFSDHSIGIMTSLAASTMGACLIEKHFRDIKNTPSPDDIHSITKEQFSELIKSIRNVEKAKGNGQKIPTDSEMKNRLNSRVSIIAISDIKKGTVITEDMIDVRRPSTGIPPEYFSEIVGKKAVSDIDREQPLKFENLEQS